MLTKKIQDYTIEVNKIFVLRKEKVYLLSRGEVCESIEGQLRKEYIKLSKLSQIALVFFVEKKNSKKIVQDYSYLNEWTVKQLSFVSYFEHCKNISMKKVFTELDLCQSYNCYDLRLGSGCNLGKDLRKR